MVLYVVSPMVSYIRVSLYLKSCRWLKVRVKYLWLVSSGTLQTICTQGTIEESGEKIERLKAACHTKLSETNLEWNCGAHFAEEGSVTVPS